MSPVDEAKKPSKEHEIPFETFMEQGKNSIVNKLSVMIEQFQKFMELQTNQKAEGFSNKERASGARQNTGGKNHQNFVSEALRPARVKVDFPRFVIGEDPTIYICKAEQ
ncbi:hypothetical protein MKX03_034518 [Papaver bracteatum]|nr:hypothetical protein MKX03_034518 [Papaver bracteatum]